MIKLTYEQVMEKLIEKSGKSKEELDAKIKEKLDQLSGLISKDGAAHIVANELGINLFESFTGKVKINKLVAGLRNVDVVGKVQAVYELREFTSARGPGKVQSFMMADETGLTRVTCWNDMVEKMASVAEGSTVLVKNVYVRENQGRLELHLNDRSEIEINPEGEKIENVATVAPRREAVRKKIGDLTDADQSVELFGTVVQAFEPHFFEVCPKCGKRARPKDGSFACDAHGVVTPDYSFVMNAVLDDASDTIRCVFFRDQATGLVGKSKEEFLAYRESPDSFDSVKIDLLGKMVKLQGRVSRNDMFDRLEFVARVVDTDPDPEAELARLKVDS